MYSINKYPTFLPDISNEMNGFILINNEKILGIQWNVTLNTFNILLKNSNIVIKG